MNHMLQSLFVFEMKPCGRVEFENLGPPVAVVGDGRQKPSCQFRYV